MSWTIARLAAISSNGYLIVLNELVTAYRPSGELLYAGNCSRSAMRACEIFNDMSAKLGKNNITL